MRILIVEDEKQLALPLAQLLRQKNYQAECVHTGPDGLDYALSGQYDAIILDIMLPGLSGLEVLAKLRAAGLATPVLLLTALGEDDDVVAGLNAGADDYLPKPFSSEVLVARLRAITRRKGEAPAADGALCFGDVRLHVEELMLACEGGRSVAISRKEALVMETLVRAAPRVCTKEAIIVAAWGYEADAADNNVEVYISFLRKKLAHIHAACRIETVRGVGYKLEAPHV